MDQKQKVQRQYHGQGLYNNSEPGSDKQATDWEYIADKRFQSVSALEAARRTLGDDNNSG